MIEPISLATITAALTVLGTEIAKGTASEVGKDLWLKTKGLFGWAGELSTNELPEKIANRLLNDDELFAKVVALLQSVKKDDATAQTIGPLVQNLNATKAIVANYISTVTM